MRSPPASLRYSDRNKEMNMKRLSLILSSVLILTGFACLPFQVFNPTESTPAEVIIATKVPVSLETTATTGPSETAVQGIAFKQPLTRIGVWDWSSNIPLVGHSTAVKDSHVAITSSSSPGIGYQATQSIPCLQADPPLPSLCSFGIR